MSTKHILETILTTEENKIKLEHLEVSTIEKEPLKRKKEPKEPLSTINISPRKGHVHAIWKNICGGIKEHGGYDGGKSVVASFTYSAKVTTRGLDSNGFVIDNNAFTTIDTAVYWGKGPRKASCEQLGGYLINAIHSVIAERAHQISVEVVNPTGSVVITWTKGEKLPLDQIYATADEIRDSKRPENVTCGMREKIYFK